MLNYEFELLLKEKKIMKKVVVILLIVVGIIVLLWLFSSVVVIQPGERGVVFRPMGSGLDKEHVLTEGVHIIAPWNQIYIYDVREQTIAFNKQDNNEYGTLDVLDKNGLTINVEVTVRFYPVFTKIGYIHEQFGKNYVQKLVIPEVRSSVRRIMGQYTAEEIYSLKRQEVEQKIIRETDSVLEKNYIKMTALLIRSIEIPDELRKAIEDKLTKQQEALAYDYVLQKEEKEKQRKVIQAEGIAQYNQIINASMTDKVLTYEGIQATLELAKSQNAKIVIIGNNENGLPIMLSQ